MHELAAKPVRKVAHAVSITISVFIFTIAFVMAAKTAEGDGAAPARSGQSQTDGHKSYEQALSRQKAVVSRYQVGLLHATTSTLSPVNTVANSASTIDVWYGLNQSFGHIGIPQKWVNILGNVSDPDGIKTLVYSLNSVPQGNLNVGPDNRRLESAGDFNIDIDRADLKVGSNQIVITATDNMNFQATETVQVIYANNNAWPIPYAINWSGVGDIQDVAQVVDGLWSVSPAGLKTDIIGYDRLVAIGDVSWSDYEVKVPITVHSVNSGGNPPGVGVLMRWPGHSLDNPVICSQPKCGYIPNGNLGWFRFRDDVNDVNLEFLNPAKSVDFSSSFPLGTTYWFKIRVETQPGGSSRYRLRVWQGPNEPAGWNLDVTESPADDQPTGSFLLVAHQADATFGNVTVVPVGAPPSYLLTVNEVGNGTVALDPPGGIYEDDTVVKLTPMPTNQGWYFNGWTGPNAGDLIDNGDGTWSITMDADKNVTATFTEGATLNLISMGQGSVEVVPSGDTYPIGTQVTLTPAPDSSWTFDSWSGPNAGDLLDNGDGTWSITMNENKSVTAIFIEQHKVLIPFIEKP